MYPTSILGKTVAGFIICIGLCTVAIPIGVIGANFSVIFDKQQRKYYLIEKHYKKKEKTTKN